VNQLQVKGLTKVFQDGRQSVKALNEINFTARLGEFVCIIGPNGCGKSSLLKIIAGIMPPTSGNLKLNGAVAYLPQQPSLLPWRTVEQNLYLPSDLSQATNPAVKSQVSELLKQFGLIDFAGYYPKALSGGMQQKVALLRTAMSKPSLMLLDEPFAALDSLTRLSLQSWLLELWQRQKNTVVCVTHDISETIFLADTVYVFSDRPGKIKLKLTVDLPRPRLQKHLTSPKAIRLEKQLRELLVP
jgi:ABC-type nitrate/sulfonate/bicarbonate transport system ATPase subunit